VAFDVDDCWDEVSTSVSRALRFDTDKVEYDGVAAATCLKEAESRATCNELGKMVQLMLSSWYDDFAVEKALPGSCRSAFSGKVPLGGECDSRFECQKPKDGSDVVCTSTSEGNPTCQRYRPAGEGVAAGASGDACVASCTTLEDCHVDAKAGEQVACLSSDGLGCYNYVCEPLPKLGEACQLVGLPCENGGYCDFGTCEKQLADGEPCSGRDECLSGDCNELSVCGARDPIIYACERIPR
jgi:hypothetical protein